MYGRFATNIVIIKEVKICHPFLLCLFHTHTRPSGGLIDGNGCFWKQERKEEETPLFPPFVAVSTPKEHHPPG